MAAVAQAEEMYAEEEMACGPQPVTKLEVGSCVCGEEKNLVGRCFNLPPVHCLCVTPKAADGKRGD